MSAELYPNEFEWHKQRATLEAEVIRLQGELAELKAEVEVEKAFFADEQRQNVRLREELAKVREALEFIAYRGQHSGIITCPQDYSYYVKPMQDRARRTLEMLGMEDDDEQS